MKIKKTVLWILLICCCSVISGCLYLRLYEVKNQLAKFDEYFDIEEGERFLITAKKPVLLNTDIVKILQGKPSAEKVTDEKLFYDYTFIKQYAGNKDETANYDITFTLVCVDKKLTECYIDKRYFAIVPKDIVIEILKLMGGAKVDTKKRTVSGSSGGSSSGQSHLPDVNEVKLLLGKPYSMEGNIYTYKYMRKSSEIIKPDEKEILPVVLTFDDKGNLQKCHSKILGSVNLVFASEQSTEQASQTKDANSP
jgi:hypothetical protein